MAPSLITLSLALLAERAAAHAILTTPAPRPNLNIAPGVKLQPFAQAKALADAGCGGLQNKDPGVQRPTIAYTPGSPVQVSWQLTIPHPTDVLDTGDLQLRSLAEAAAYDLSLIHI